MIQDSKADSQRKTQLRYNFTSQSEKVEVLSIILREILLKEFSEEDFGGSIHLEGVLVYCHGITGALTHSHIQSLNQMVCESHTGIKTVLDQWISVMEWPSSKVYSRACQQSAVSTAWSTANSC
ncbi:hypothetical protein MHYP_G00070020 [Metynnis hypsauchen]